MKPVSTRKKRAAAITIVVLLVGIVGAAAVIGATRTGTRGDAGVGTATDSAGFPGDTGEKALGPDAVPQSGDEAAEDGARASGSGDVNGSLPPLVNPGQYLIRTGNLVLVVGRDKLDESVLKVTTITRAYDGYILSSQVGTMSGGGVTPEPMPLDQIEGDVKGGLPVESLPVVDDGEPYASITVRVPAARFDDALARFQRLGQVRSLDTSTDDVTSQIVDLRARLRHYQTVEERLLSFLDKAKTVGAALAVQDRIDQTQMMVEELRAQLKQLGEMVTYSTISISMTENVPKAGVIDQSDSFWGAIKHSLSLVVDGFRWMAVALGAALPFLIVLAALGGVVFWLVRRTVRRRRTRDGQDGRGGTPATSGAASPSGEGACS
jgi:hypothetical protein